MSFLYPGFLWALTACLIPVIIHLFSFRRYRTVYFSNTRFLENIQRDTRSRSQIKQILILLSRILLIAALVFAFAQPFIPSETSEDGGTHVSYVAVYIDNSFSMQNEGEGGSLLDMARQKAMEISDAYGNEYQFFLLSNDMPARFYHSMDRAGFETAVSGLDISPKHMSLSRLTQRLNTILKPLLKEKEVAQFYVISDFQENMADVQAIEANEQIKMQFVNLPAMGVNNLYVDSAWFDTPYRRLGQKEQLHVHMQNFGSEAYNNISLKLFIGDSLKAINSIQLPPEGATTATMSFTTSKPGIRQAYLQIEDYPVSFDNHFYLQFEVAGIREVLIITPDGQSPYFEALYRDNPNLTSRVVSINNLDLSDLQTHDVLIIDRLKAISSGMASQLEQALRLGRNLIFIPPEDARTGSWNDFLQILRAPKLSDLIEEESRLKSINYEHPFFNGVFPESQEDVNMPKLKTHYKLQYLPGSFPDKLIALDNGDAFLNMLPYGNAFLFLFNAPISKKNGDFARHPLFVPTGLHMALNVMSTKELYYISGRGESFEMPLQTSSNDLHFKIASDTAASFIPAYRLTPSGVRIFIPDALMQAGNYKLLLEDKPISGFALNYDRSESRLAYKSAETLQAQAGEYGIHLNTVITAGDESISADIREQAEGKRLWFWFLLAAACFVLAEILLIRLLKD